MNHGPEDLPPHFSQPRAPIEERRGFGAAVRAYFLTGLLVAGPLAVTAYIIWWLVALIDGWVRPLIPAAYNPETYLTFTLPGVGILAGFIGLTLLGFLTANLVGRTLVGLGERILSGMPVVRSVYKGVKQIFETVFRQGATSFRQVGLIEWPGPGHWTLCLIAGPASEALTTYLPEGRYLNVFVPCTPNPTTGYFVVMRDDQIREIDMSVEDVFKIIMSMGIIQPEIGAPKRPRIG